MPVDYAALAEQARKTTATPPVDYAALAQQARGESSPATTAAPERSFVQRLGKSADSTFANNPASGPNHFDEHLRPVGNIGRTAVRDIAHMPEQLQNLLTPKLASPPSVGDLLGDLIVGPAYGATKSLVSGAMGSYREGGLEQALTDTAGHALAGYLTGKATQGLIKGGGLVARGGGLAAEAAAATPESLKVASTRAIVPGTPEELLTKAVRPTVNYGDFESDISRVTPELKNGPAYGGLKGLGQTLESIKANANEWYRGITDPLRNFKADASPIADAQMKSVPITDRIEQPPRLVPGNPGRLKTVTVPAGEGTKLSMGGVVGATPDSLEGGIMNRTAAKADNFRRDMPLGVIDDVRQHTNADLQSIWNKNGGDRYAALADAENARKFATNGASRDIAYDNFSRLNAAGRTDMPTLSGEIPAPGAVTPGAIADNQNLFGAANKLDDVVNKRGVVFGRESPASLAERVALTGGKGIVGGIKDFAVQRLLKGITNPDALTNAAIDRMRNPESIQLLPRPGMLPKAASIAGQGAGSFGRAIQGTPSLFFAPKKQDKN
jgi:hypothetical protein